MSDLYLGQLAGLGTAILFTATSLLFTAASKRLGPVAVNALRIYLAIGLLGLTHQLREGTWLPEALPGQVFALGLSGLIGLTLGDLALFYALVAVGPRLATLVMASAPLFACLLGYAVLGEELPPLVWLGVFLIIGGITWVVAERPAAEEKRPSLRGVALAVVAAICQATGLLLSKRGIGHGWLPREQFLSAQAASLIRMLFAGLGIVPLLWVLRRRAPRGAPAPAVSAEERRRGVLLTGAGAVFGPFLGVWMSLVASDLAPLGVAQTLCSLTPIFILPYLAFVAKERVSPRSVLGALLAALGTALLFLWPASPG